MTDNNYAEQDELWTSLQRMFSPDDALIFRNYPIRVENSVRELS
jgi:hypothetical protein